MPKNNLTIVRKKKQTKPQKKNHLGTQKYLFQ